MIVYMHCTCTRLTNNVLTCIYRHIVLLIALASAKLSSDKDLKYELPTHAAQLILRKTPVENSAYQEQVVVEAPAGGEHAAISRNSDIPAIILGAHMTENDMLPHVSNG